VRLSRYLANIFTLFIFFVLVFGWYSAVSGQGLVTIPYSKSPNVVVDGAVSPGEYPSNFTDPNNGMVIYWVHDDNYLYVAMVSPGTGWVAVGFGSQVMDGANIIIGYVDDTTGETVLSDQTGEGHGHEPDTNLGGSDDLVDFAGSQSGGSTTIEFVFPLNSGDSLDPPLEPGTSTYMILAYHPSADDLTSYHGATYDVISVFVEAPGVVGAIMFISTNTSDLTMGEAVAVKIKFTTSENKPIANAPLNIYTTTTFKDADPVVVATALTDASGVAETVIRYTVPGDFKIYASFEGGLGGIKPTRSNLVEVHVKSPYEQWPIYPEDPYYNWGWFVVNFPHLYHGTPSLDLSPISLAVMVPLFSVILGVWFTYLYVYRLIFRIKRGG